MQYRIIRSDRKTVALQIREGEVIVRAPRAMRESEIAAFIKKHESWVQKKLSAQAKSDSEPPLSNEDIRALADRALQVIPPRVKYYAAVVGVHYNRVTVRNQKTKWGRCSGKGNLNFNCLLMLAPIEVLDSVIVNELCHLKHMNHSKAFYDEVLRAYPLYHKWNRWLKENGGALIRRMTQR